MGEILYTLAILALALAIHGLCALMAMSVTLYLFPGTQIGFWAAYVMTLVCHIMAHILGQLKGN